MTKRVALLGHPVGHSRSPAMHNAAFRELGLDWNYELLDVEPERFAEVVRDLPSQGFAGANVTIPHKLRALEAADSASSVARAVGAANTLVFADGRIHAENTDVEGFLEALRERAPGAPAGSSALVLGAGGAARAAESKAPRSRTWPRSSSISSCIRRIRRMPSRLMPSSWESRWISRSWAMSRAE